MLMLAQRVRTAVATRCDHRRPCMDVILPDVDASLTVQGDSAGRRTLRPRVVGGRRVALTSRTFPAFGSTRRKHDFSIARRRRGYLAGWDGRKIAYEVASRPADAMTPDRHFGSM